MLTHCGTIMMETERLILRRFCKTDAESAYRNWAGDRKIQENYGEPVYDSIEKTTELLMKYIERYENEETYRWAVILKENGECIGQAAFFLVDSRSEYGEIEYCIGAKYQKRGFATEATLLLIKYGFECIHFHKIDISARPSNHASLRVIEKCGFTFEARLRDKYLHGGTFEDSCFYSMLDSEYFSRKTSR